MLTSTSCLLVVTVGERLLQTVTLKARYHLREGLTPEVHALNMVRERFGNVSSILRIYVFKWFDTKRKKVMTLLYFVLYLEARDVTKLLVGGKSSSDTSRPSHLTPAITLGRV